MKGEDFKKSSHLRNISPDGIDDGMDMNVSLQHSNRFCALPAGRLRKIKCSHSRMRGTAD